MDIWDLLLFTWLFKDDIKGNTEKKAKTSTIHLIFGLATYYLIILGIIALILWLIDVKFSSVIYWLYTVLFGIFGLLLIISDIVSRFKR